MAFQEQNFVEGKFLEILVIAISLTLAIFALQGQMKVEEPLFLPAIVSKVAVTRKPMDIRDPISSRSQMRDVDEVHFTTSQLLVKQLEKKLTTIAHELQEIQEEEEELIQQHETAQELLLASNEDFKDISMIDSTSNRLHNRIESVRIQKMRLLEDKWAGEEIYSKAQRRLNEYSHAQKKFMQKEHPNLGLKVDLQTSNRFNGYSVSKEEDTEKKKSFMDWLQVAAVAAPVGFCIGSSFVLFGCTLVWFFGWDNQMYKRISCISVVSVIAGEMLVTGLQYLFTYFTWSGLGVAVVFVMGVAGVAVA